MFSSSHGVRLFHIIVTPPATSEGIQQIANIYSKLGLPGAVGSTDCTHIPLGKCPVSWRNSCIGKEGFPTLAYSMTCDHTRKILHCTGGFPGSYNDKTIARYDSFITEVAQNPLYKDFKYNVQTQTGEVVEKKGDEIVLKHLFLIFSIILIILFRCLPHMRRWLPPLEPSHVWHEANKHKRKQNLEHPNGECAQRHRMLLWHFEGKIQNLGLSVTVSQQTKQNGMHNLENLY